MMNSRIPARLPARFTDSIQFASSRAYVLQLHLVLEFAECLTAERVERALRLILAREPVLGCRYVLHWRKPYWERLGPAELENARLLSEVRGNAAVLEDAREAFLAGEIDAHRGPQLEGLLIHEPAGDTLIVKVNHQVVDAGGTKELGYLLAETYRELGSGREVEFVPNLGSRSLRQVYRRFSFWRLLRIFGGYFREVAGLTRPFDTLSFPSGTEESGKWHFTVRRFPAERVRAFRAYCRERDATLNDLFVAALFRAIADLTGWRGDRTLRMISTVDLRRYLPGRRAEALCNLAGFFYPNVGREMGENLDQTLSRVKRDTDEQKRGDLGLSSLFGDWVLGLPAPYAVQRLLLQKVFGWIAASGNIVPTLTNLGPIEPDALDFGGMKPLSAEVLVPPFRPPFFGVGLSGYRGALSLSAGYFPSGIPIEKVEGLLDRLDSMLPS